MGKALEPFVTLAFYCKSNDSLLKVKYGVFLHSLAWFSYKERDHPVHINTTSP